MKKTITFLIVISTFGLAAQPVIQDGTNIPAVGTMMPVTIAATTNPGGSGANVIWDFSMLTFNPLGTLTYVTPSTSTFGSSFPTSNLAYSVALSGGGNIYSYYNVGSSQMDALALGITAPGAGQNDYSPDPRKHLAFPFSYTNSFTDTWQKVGDTPNTVTMTYDGYGTVITPVGTYTNVIRVKADYGSGSDYDWYLTNPLMALLTFDHNNNMIYYFGASPTSVEEENGKVKVSAWPNPSSGDIQFKFFGNFEGSVLSFYNSLGELTKEIAVTSPEMAFSRENLCAGIYYYNVTKNGERLSSGKLLFE